MPRHLRFQHLAATARPRLQSLLRKWLPHGRVTGREYVALNPTRTDRHPGSFKINLATGRWADFATGAKGGDAIALYAYLERVSQKRCGSGASDGSNAGEVWREAPANDRHEGAPWLRLSGRRPI